MIVPGHGSVVDRHFIEEQAAKLQQVGDEISQAHDRGIRAEQVAFSAAVREIWPPEFLRSAVDDGFSQLSADGSAHSGKR